MTLLQTEQAKNILSETAQAGLAFGIMVVIILVMGWVIWKLWKESKDKSKAHGEAMAKKDADHAEAIKIKDDKIEEMTEKLHNMALSNVATMKDWIEAIRSLRNT